MPILCIFAPYEFLPFPGFYTIFTFERRVPSNSITRLAYRKFDVQSRSHRWNLSMKEKRGGLETPMTLNDIRAGDGGTSIRKKPQRSKQDESVAGSRHLRARDSNRESRG